MSSGYCDCVGVYATSASTDFLGLQKLLIINERSKFREDRTENNDVRSNELNQIWIMDCYITVQSAWRTMSCILPLTHRTLAIHLAEFTSASNYRLVSMWQSWEQMMPSTRVEAFDASDIQSKKLIVKTLHKCAEYSAQHET